MTAAGLTLSIDLLHYCYNYVYNVLGLQNHFSKSRNYCLQQSHVPWGKDSELQIWIIDLNLGIGM